MTVLWEIPRQQFLQKGPLAGEKNRVLRHNLALCEKLKTPCGLAVMRFVCGQFHALYRKSQKPMLLFLPFHGR